MSEEDGFQERLFKSGAGSEASGLKRAFTMAMQRQNSGDLEGAVQVWRAILMQDPDYIPALNNLGVALRRLGRIAESDAVLRAGIERAPISAELFVSHGKTLQQWGRSDSARDAFVKASHLNPSLPDPHHALGLLHWEEGRLSEAVHAFTTALICDTEHLPSLIAMGDARADQGEVSDAAGYYRRAAAIDPERIDVTERIADLLLLAGDYGAGFREKARIQRSGFQELTFTEAAQWEGGPLEGRHLRVHCEGGYSEIFLLIRLLRQIEGGRVSVICAPDLVEILNGCGWLESVAANTEELPECDVTVPLSLIPSFLSITPDEILNPPPYLRPDPASLSVWRQHLPGDGKVPVGIVWDSGSSRIPLAAFEPLARLEFVTLVSLQKGESRRELSEVGFDVLDLGSTLDEGKGAFVDSAALLANLPLVVGVEHPVLHLAGALDRPGYVLARSVPDWCWGLDEAQTPWYPSLDLIRLGTDAGTKPGMTEIAARLQGLKNRLNRGR